jgi:hypothetical protein
MQVDVNVGASISDNSTASIFRVDRFSVFHFYTVFENIVPCMSDILK